jgi:hypothetical protein
MAPLWTHAWDVQLELQVAIYTYDEEESQDSTNMQ